jgi:O-antigen/teichoic acid export membrane protein
MSEPGQSDSEGSASVPASPTPGSHANSRTVSNIARNAGVQLSAEMVSKLASLALYVVVARVLGPRDFGDFVFSSSLALLMTVVAGFGIEGLVVRDVARDPGVASGLLSDAVSLKAATGALGVLGAVAIAIIAGYRPEVCAAVAVFAIGAVVDLIAKGYYSVFQALDDMRPTAACQVVQRYSTAIVGIAVVALGGGVAALASAFLVGSVLAIVLAIRWLARRGVSARRRPSRSGALALAKASFAFGISNVFSTVLFRADATMLSLIKGNVAVGLYGVAYRLLESTLFVTYAFTAALMPTIARLRRDTKPSIARGYELGSKVLALMLVPVGDVLVAFPHEIVYLVYGNKYAAADGVCRLLGGAAVLYGFAYLSSVVLIVQHRTRVLAWGHGLVMVQNIALNLVLIPPLSYKGAALATTISEVTRAGLLMRYAVKATGPIRVVRILLAPLVGTAGLAAVALTLGGGLPALAVGVLCYSLCALVVEYVRFPGDARLLRTALLRGGGALEGSSEGWLRGG